VFNEAALVDLGDQGIRLCVIMPLADFGFFRSTGQMQLIPGEFDQMLSFPARFGSLSQWLEAALQPH
jgi:hypothetical protein